MSAPSGYSHMNYHDRRYMSMLINKGYSYRMVGERIGISHTTVMREFNRNCIIKKGKLIYDPIVAHQNFLKRKYKSKGYKIDRFSHLKTLIYNKLKDGWSPEVISGFIKRECYGISISHEAIYQYIYKVHRDWIKFLRYGLMRRRRKNKYQKRTKTLIPGRVSIDKRPKHISKREEFGHFEVDTMVSRKSKESLLVVLERKTRSIKLRRLERKTSEALKISLINALKHFKSAVKTITYDNGTENVLHQEVNAVLGCNSYFCNPYHSWEKGSVENAIGIVRRFIPKGKDISEVSDYELQVIEQKINSRPRKILDYNTPRKEFNAEWCTYC